MRIISGKYRGKKLVEINGKDIRPTPDRVRESIFNIIQFKVNGCNFLDLFCGTGAMGIEAISRGAENVFFCDKNTDTINKNLELLNEYSNVLNCDYNEALEIFKRTERKFDIIFLDPPYKSDAGILSIKKIVQSDILTDEGVIIFETISPLEKFDEIQNMNIKTKKYGISYVNIIEKV